MLKDLLFPKACLGCGYFGCYICRTCEKKLVPNLLNTCLYCEKISYLGLTHRSCKTQNGVDGVLSMYSYNPIMRSIIKNIKYKGVYDVFPELFQVVREPAILKFYKFLRLYKDASLQPIPLHKSKLKSRGFNQSEYLSKYFQLLFGYKQIDLLIRTKETNAQAQIKDKASRSINMKEAFSTKRLSHHEAIKTVIVVDDVVTTGSTVKEATVKIKELGVMNVFVFSFARG